MTLQGRLIEYLEDDKFICALVIEDTGKRLRLLNEKDREINLPASRLIHQSETFFAVDAPRDQILLKLREISKIRHKLSLDINLHEVWELTTEAADNSFSPFFLAELCFGDKLTDNHVAAFLRTVFQNRLFFKYKAGQIIAHTPEAVEQLQQCRQREKERQALLENGAVELLRIKEGQPPRKSPELDTCLQLVRDYYLFGTEAPEKEMARNLLKQARLTGTHDAFHLLVKAGIWDKDENIHLLRQDIPQAFPATALAQAEGVEEASLETLLAAGRKDFRHLKLLTIDGDATRDYDDALHIEQRGANFLVGIHITDVAYYIPPGGALFEEALRRGTSIYLPEGQIPMLPKRLSEGVCSLVAGKSRPAMSFMVLLSPDGEVVEYTLVPSIVRVERQLTYTESDRLIHSDNELATLARLSTKLRQRRLEAGALLLPFPDVNIDIGTDGIHITTTDADTPSRVLVSEFMTLANILGAKFIADRELPGLFRSQPPPQQRLLDGFSKDLYLLTRQRKKLSPMTILSKAKPHSCVGTAQYTTVTSPIRRLLDLIMQHQILHLALGKGQRFSKKELNSFAATITTTVGKANGMRYLRRRYWILKHLETKRGERVPALVIDKGYRKIQLLLPDTMLEAEIPASPGINAPQGGITTVKLAKVNALDNQLHLEP